MAQLQKQKARGQTRELMAATTAVMLATQVKRSAAILAAVVCDATDQMAK
jgi:hypothetical protein